MNYIIYKIIYKILMFSNLFCFRFLSFFFLYDLKFYVVLGEVEIKD